MDGLWSHIVDVKTPLMLSAFAVAALLSAFNVFLKKPTATVRRGLWGIVGAICLIAIVPVIASEFLKVDTIYRVRITTVDARNNTPVAGATVRVTAASESKTATDGSCELAIPRGSLPQDRKITIFADKSDEFIHGSSEIILGSDPNPSLIIILKSDRTAGIRGMVKDGDSHALEGVRVNIPGTKAVVTDESGSFELPAQAAVGQRLFVHFEKRGYISWDQWVYAGDDIVITMRRDSREKNIKP